MELTKEQREEMFNDYISGTTIPELAKKYRTKATSTGTIVRRMLAKTELFQQIKRELVERDMDSKFNHIKPVIYAEVAKKFNVSHHIVKAAQQSIRITKTKGFNPDSIMRDIELIKDSISVGERVEVKETRTRYDSVQIIGTVVSVTENLFTVQSTHYRESFSYADIFSKKIKINKMHKIGMKINTKRGRINYVK